MTEKILYKYRNYNSRSLSMLKNKEIYFSNPNSFNDPVDCKINILSAVKAAIKLAEHEEPATKNKLEEIEKLTNLFSDIEEDVKHAGVYSLSKEENNVLMWSHYADKHKGFSVGFSLSNNFIKFNERDEIIGTADVSYSEDNPFIKYFLSITKNTKLPSWDEFWPCIFSMALTSKSKEWTYENEVRIIRGNPGVVNFSPSELIEVIFGLEMNEDNKNNLKAILSGNEWKHIQMKEVIREDNGLQLKLISH